MTPAAPGRRWPVWLILTGIVFALVLPGLIFCAVLLHRFAESEWQQGQAEAQAAALRTAAVLDRELEGLIAALRALGTSPLLANGEIPPFEAHVRAFAAATRRDITLTRADGQQLINTRLPPGTPLPKITSSPGRQRAVTTLQPVVSDLFVSIINRPSLAVLLPIPRTGEDPWVLSLIVDPSELSGLLQRQSLPAGWVASIVDSQNLIVARSVAHAETLGRPASPDLQQNATGQQGTWFGSTVDGTSVLAAYARTGLASWRIAVGVPLAYVTAPLQQTLVALVLAGLASLGLAGLLIWRLGRSVASPLRRLAAAGAALGQGRPFRAVPSRITEVQAVSEALTQATADLGARAEALAGERARLAAIIETVPVGILIAGTAGQTLAANAEAERILGTGLRGDGVPEVIAFHADGRRVAFEELPMMRCLRGAEHAALLCRVQQSDGAHIWVQVEAAPIRAGDGTITSAVVALLDIDELMRAREEIARFAENLEGQVTARTAELKAANQRLRDEITGRAAAEEQLRQSQKMEAVGRLTGGIAHDFNNLLTIVIGSLDLLRRRTGGDDRNRRLLDNALEGAARAATLTARLLAFSRQQALAPQPLDVNRLVAGMSDLLHRTLGETVQMETVLAGGLWQTFTDPNQLENALLNLAVNARDAIQDTPAGTGRLTVETANAHLDEAYAAGQPEVTPGQYVLIAVTDTGTGMEPGVVDRVFEPFFTTKPQGQGTGLGLSQVHGFVKQSGGHVKIYTERGHGTTVKVYLPRYIAAESEQPAPSSPSAAPAGHGEAVLVVEDEGGVRRFSTDALRELGYVVLEAANAAAALRLLDAHPEVGLLFTDVVLPETNGRQLAEEARRRRPGLPVLFTTGYTRNAIVHNGQLDSGVDLIGKPFTLEALAAKLREVLDRG